MNILAFGSKAGKSTLPRYLVNNTPSFMPDKDATPANALTLQAFQAGLASVLTIAFAVYFPQNIKKQPL